MMWLIYSVVRGNRMIMDFGVRNKFESEITICKLKKLVHFSFLFRTICVKEGLSEVLYVKSLCKL